MRNLFFFIFICIDLHLEAQHQLSGYIQDETGGLAGVKVWIHETENGTFTDSAGFFTLTDIKKGHYHLHVYLESYQSFQQSIHIHQDTSISIRLFPTSIEIKQVVIESDLLKTSRQESSLSIDGLSTEDIIKLPNQNVVQALERIPGVKNMNVGVGIAKPVIRGFSMNRVLVAENGIKQEGQQWGQDHGLELDSWSVDQVEIIRGPATLLYGSDAMGGVIHLKNKWIANNCIEGRLVSGFRSVNGNPYTAMRIGLTKNGWMFQSLASYQLWRDYSIPADSFIYNDFRFAIPNQKLKNTAGKENNFGLRLGLRKNWGSILVTGSHFHQFSGFFAGAFGIPSAYSLSPDGKPYQIDFPSQQVNHDKIQVQAKILLGHDWLETEFGWQMNVRRELSLPHTHGSVSNQNLALLLQLKTFSSNLRYNRIFENGMKWIIGFSGQYQTNNIGGFEFLLAGFKRKQVGTFTWIQKDWLKKWYLHIGARLDYVQISSGGFIQNLANGKTWERVKPYDKQFKSPCVSAGLSWLPAKDWNLKINLSSDFRFPAPNELLTNGIHHGNFRHELGSEALKPERGFQSDFSVSYSRRHWEFQCSPFYSWIQDYIFLTPSARFSTLKEGGQVYEYRQTNALMTGLECRTEWHSFTWIHLGLQADYVQGENKLTYLPLPFIPQPSASFQLELTKDSLFSNIQSLFFNLELKKLFSQLRTDKNESPTQGSFVCNLSTGFHVTWRKQKFIFVCQVQNLFNTAWLSHISRYRMLELPEPGRNINIALHIPFSKNITEKEK